MEMRDQHATALQRTRLRAHYNDNNSHPGLAPAFVHSGQDLESGATSSELARLKSRIVRSQLPPGKDHKTLIKDGSKPSPVAFSGRSCLQGQDRAQNRTAGRRPRCQCRTSPDPGGARGLGLQIVQIMLVALKIKIAFGSLV